MEVRGCGDSGVGVVVLSVRVCVFEVEDVFVLFSLSAGVDVTPMAVEEGLLSSMLPVGTTWGTSLSHQLIVAPAR